MDKVTENAVTTTLKSIVVPLANSPLVVPPELEDMVAEDARKGTSQNAEDLLTPLIYVLQAGSTQLDKRGGSYVPGAEPGHFYLRGAARDPIRDGVAGFMVVPCVMERAWFEWYPSRGGYAGRHAQRPDDAEARLIDTDSGKRRALVRRSNGNTIQETRELIVLVDGEFPFILPCYGTRNAFARELQTYLNQLRHPVSGALLPAFAHRYLLTTVLTGNAMGKWFTVKFQNLGFVSRTEYERARKLYADVINGVYRPEALIDNGF
jgi:hypothetical protein